MELEVINPHVLKIMIGARKEDSISAISKRISLSYGWTHKWVQELAEFGAFKLTRMKVYLNEDNEFYKRTLKYIRESFSSNVQYHYNVLALFGVKYAFTKIDAVFVWTNGGYNIARFRDFYPIFIKIKKKDKKVFYYYWKKLNLSTKKNKGIFFQIEYLDDFLFDFHNGIPVDSLDETIKFMEKNKYNFEPALEMIKEIYKKKIKVKYKESVTNVWKI